MNTNGPAKFYDELTSHERLPLIVAASVRNDVVERTRLVESAPRMAFTVPHHYGLAQALGTAADYHLLTLLDLAAIFWQWWGLWGWHGLRRQDRADQNRDRGKGGTNTKDVEDVRLCCMVRYQAFLLMVHVEGWKKFCSDMSVDPEAQLNFKPGWDMIIRTKARAGDLAFTREEAAMFLLSETFDSQKEASEEPELPQVLTAERLAKDWQTFVDRRAEMLLGNGNL
jgi:hypothetical protein